jgi:hypothetical protein
MKVSALVAIRLIGEGNGIHSPVLNLYKKTFEFSKALKMTVYFPTGGESLRSRRIARLQRIACCILTETTGVSETPVEGVEAQCAESRI